ncbi:heptaprenyl diphosphate synthase component 1 [Paenibacillus hexagrammi]|uniref:Heptaprenyl diphosphate synthase component 1 n=1 Tax=Paenibacillus hexagrammi TaxID=2908839 RepID=A0ABY3SSV2_9BACL|nr:heptaprenyl diphosphate synthase component 1 [Paenibacillus sp. YPD9-1]UJF36190.1 heptaprenyl diphosphate synthase component 1 [Paenibacillus sp. YPD9-1]
MNSFRIPEMAKQYTEYDMIQNHTDLPEFPELRTRLLFAFLSGSTKYHTSSELYSLAASLVQLGLDTHDQVTPSNEQKEKKAARSRQLQVLAGDYFSSRFYHLLSQAGQIDMIKQLAGAICDVNRMKMSLYTKMKQLKVTAEDYLHQTVEIKSQLFLAFSEVMAEVYDQTWPEILQAYSKCEVLFEEIFRIESASNLHGSWGFWHILQHGTKEERKQLHADEPDHAKIRTLMHKYHISSLLYQMLETHIKQLHNKIGQLDSDKLVSELFHIAEPFLRFLSKPKVLEDI